LPHTSAPPLVIAHRGASADRPENTLPAYALAVEQGADMIEIDLHLSRDGAIVIAHDADLGHFGAEGMIGEQTLAELRGLDATGGRAERETIPTLDEVLDAFAPGIPFNLELKWGSDGPYPGLPSAALEAVESRGLLKQTLFSSFDDSILQELRRLSSGARLAALVDPRQPEPRNMVERARGLGAEAVNPHFILVNADLVRDAHAEGLAVYVYTVDKPDAMRTLLELGVDGLFTNRPEWMRALVDGQPVPGGPGDSPAGGQASEKGSV